MSELPLNPNTGKPFEPITDERLAELDDWYRKCKSNSLMFCDGDYLEMRARLKALEAALASAEAEKRWQNDQLAVTTKALNAAVTERDEARRKRDEAVQFLREVGEVSDRESKELVSVRSWATRWKRAAKTYIVTVQITDADKVHFLLELQAENDRVRRENDGMRDALYAITRELGVPQPNYPAPVTNAVKIALAALATFEMKGETK